MKVSDFNYQLPQNLIAQKPKRPRDHSRLMVIDRKAQKIFHRHFHDIGDFLKRGDILVLNDTKVMPARILGKSETKGKVEFLLLRSDMENLKNYIWSRDWWIIGRPGFQKDKIVKFPQGLEARILKVDGYKRLIRFNCHGEKLRRIIYQIGQAPTPPYIKTKISSIQLKKDYQTVYAKNIGSVAAPTAGFHFTPQLIKKLKSQGIIFKYITLHVGLGTFQPIKTRRVEDHQMMAEWAELNKKTADFLNKAREDKNRRMIIVGTTATRTLEAMTGKNGEIKAGRKFIDLFIYPGYKFKATDSLITNFHLPKSTLLMLVSALAGRNLILKAYREAINKKYRFFSFGDAMFII